MIDSVFETIQSPTVLVTTFILLAASIAKAVLRSPRRIFHGPVVGEAGASDLRKALEIGYAKVDKSFPSI